MKITFVLTNDSRPNLISKALLIGSTKTYSFLKFNVLKLFKQYSLRNLINFVNKLLSIGLINALTSVPHHNPYVAFNSP